MIGCYFFFIVRCLDLEQESRVNKYIRLRVVYRAMSVPAKSMLRLPLRISSLMRVHRVCTVSFQPCLNRLRLSHESLFQQSCSYASRWSGFGDPGDIGQPSDEPELNEFADEHDMGNYISLDEGDTPDTLKAELNREDMKFRQRIKQKIIERKHFRPPKEVNLLTWQAKAQIRHLHMISKEKWTPEYLAYHFPVSESGIIRILQNRYDPDSERAIEKHDGRVKKTWKKIKELSYIQRTTNLTGEDEALWNGAVDRLIATRLVNASGILHLPMPKSPNFDFTPEKPHGPFGSLIKNHREQLKLIEGPDSETLPKINLEDIQAENVIHLKRLLWGLAKTGLIVISDDLLREKLEHYSQSRQESEPARVRDIQVHNKRLDYNADVTGGQHTHSHNDKMIGNSDSVDTKSHSVPGPAPVAFRYLPEPSLGHHSFSAKRIWPGNDRFKGRYKQNHDLPNKYQSNSAADQHINSDRNLRYPDKYVNNHAGSKENVSEHKNPNEVRSDQDKYYTETVLDEEGNLLYRIPG